MRECCKSCRAMSTSPRGYVVAGPDFSSAHAQTSSSGCPGSGGNEINDIA